MMAITRALSMALLHFVWQGLAVTILVWLALFLLRKRSASIRYAASCAALALLVFLPPITAWALFEGSAEPSELTGVIRDVSWQTMSAASAPAIDWLGLDWLALAQTWAVPVWSCGVLLFSLRMVWGSRQIAAMRRAGEDADASLQSSLANLATRMGVTRRVRILLTTVTDSPSVMGWLRPIVLLPVSAVAGLTPDQLEAVLAHELAHIRRHDYLVNLLQMAAETLLFYHPAVWWISSRIRQERELCCDDLAVRTCGGAIPYARALTALEKMRAARPALALGSTDGPLFFRIRRLVMGGSEYGPSKLSGMVALTLGLVSLALTVNWARAQHLVVPARGIAVELQDAGGVTVDTAGSMLLHRPDLQYPKELREKGVRGTVSVEAILDNTGEVIDARVLSGPNELRKAALASVLNWHFAPGSGNIKTVQIGFQPPKLASVENVTDFTLVVRHPHSKNVVLLEEQQARKMEISNLHEETQALDQLKSEMVEAQVKLASEAHQQIASEQAHRVETLKSEFAETQAKLELARKRFADEYARQKHERRLSVEAAPDVRREEAPRTDMPRRLAGIQIAGLSEEARKDLLSRLPFREGDTLSQESAEAAAKIVKEFDQHLELNMGRFDEDVILRIHPAGFEPKIFRLGW